MDLLAVEKPARYMGGEMGSVRKDVADLRVALAFPDVYEVGMSHLGLRILYHVLNQLDGIAAERVYAPWPDREAQMREAAADLRTLETDTPLMDCHIVGFTLQYELSYTNILNMLNLARIPLLAQERDERYPLVLAGGPCAYNPEPLAPFFDAILLGDGEEAIVEIAECVRSARRAGNVAKSELLQRLAAIEGVYVPSLFEPRYHADGTVDEIVALTTQSKVRRRFLHDLDAAQFPTETVVPFMKTVHDRVAIEIARGCTRGCRFCQAGYVYRPLRERSPEEILRIAGESLQKTGYDELSLLSLSTGDYSCVAELLTELMTRYANDRVAVSLPSLRVGTLTEDLIDQIKKVRKTGFTLAPEAGSERMRRVVNKGITEQALLETAYNVFRAGWRTIKLYFMIGLPGETADDVAQIAALARKVKDQGKLSGNPGDVTVSVSNFVPKAHTPFQWDAQISTEQVLEHQYLLHTELKKKKLRFKWHDSSLSLMEGVFARGDRRLAQVLIKAVELGCRFDGWGDHFSFERWQRAFAACDIDPAWYLRQRALDEVLPWDHLDCGVTRKFLLEEREKAQQEGATADCRFGDCSGCGVCDFDTLTTRRYEKPAFTPGVVKEHVAPAAARLRLRFSKSGVMCYISHLELITIFTRAVSKGGVPILFSQGFHPHPRFSFATATSVGVASQAEYMDMFVAEGTVADVVAQQLNAVLPVGLRILESELMDLSAPSLSTLIDATHYRITYIKYDPAIVKEWCVQFLAHPAFVIERKKKGDVQRIDLRAEVVSLAADGNSVDLVARRGKPVEFARALAASPGLTTAEILIEKREVFFLP